MKSSIKYYRDIGDADVDTCNAILLHLCSLLNKEKEQILQSLNDGKAMALGNIENKSLEQYYNETFNTKEK